MSKKLPRCEFCGRCFHPDQYNAGHQKYCTRPECICERRRQRQRQWHARRYAADAAFAAAARVRCAAANRRRRLAKRSRAGPECEVELPVLRHVVLGMLSQLTDTVDTAQLAAFMRAYALRGQRVASLAPTGTGSP